MTEAQGHQQVSLGLDTFGDVTIGDDDAPLPSAQVLRDVVEQAVLADQVVTLLGQPRGYLGLNARNRALHNNPRWPWADASP